MDKYSAEYIAKELNLKKTITFDSLEVNDRIARVEGYKVECAKVIFKERISKDELKIVVKGIETKKKYSHNIRGKNCTLVGFDNEKDVRERWYADVSVINALRDGIEIGFAYARRQMTESFKPVYPFFTVNGKPVDDNK